MELTIERRYPIGASAAQAWAVLSDVTATAACLPGATITEQIDATHYKGTVKSRVGPATMSFAGDIELLSRDDSLMALSMLGKGADRSGSSASMKLTASVEPGESAAESHLVGVATVTVSGKLAQFGSRLLLPVIDALLTQFAANFGAAATAIPNPTAMPVPDTGSAPAAGATPPAPASPPNELNLLALLRELLRSWGARWFRKDRA
ncbi:MAG: carbon monoxide dehydrogenase [Burkholderiales bacterium PBB1]|nr:MAG: carbon monoxide dehydrogenase [Burkholderiales bacterium PBB1]